MKPTRDEAGLFRVYFQIMHSIDEEEVKALGLACLMKMLFMHLPLELMEWTLNGMVDLMQEMITEKKANKD